MKPPTYPYFKVVCTVDVTMPGNATYTPDLVIKLGFFIQCWDDIGSTAKREAIWRLELLGVPADALKNAFFDTGDCAYIALDSKGVRRENGTAVEAFYHCDPKKRDTLIRQRRLVPDSLAEMCRIYGTSVAVASIASEVAA